MPYRPQLYEADTATLASTETLTLDAGDTESPVRTYDLWNDKGGASADTETLSSPRLRAEVWDGDAWVSSGEPAVDEGWLEVAVTGINRNVSSMDEQTTGYVALKSGTDLVLGDIPKNCAREISLRLRVPAHATESTPQVRLVVIPGEHAAQLDTGAGVRPGVIPDRLIEGTRRVLWGLGSTGAGGEDVTVAKGKIAYDGTEKFRIAGTVTLNQNDGDAAALASGESYKAVISIQSDGTLTGTKGSKAASPSEPSTPSGEIYLATVTVDYQAGGTSVIDTADIDASGLVRGEYLVEAGSGIAVTIGAGQAICSTDKRTYHGAASSLDLTDDSTNYVWLLPTGTFTDTTTAALPDEGAILLAEVVTASAAITSVTDRRSWADDRVTLTMDVDGDFSGTVDNTEVVTLGPSVPWDAWVQEIILEVGSMGTGSGGSLKVDVGYRDPGEDTANAETTLYTSSGSSDLRPSIAYDASTLRTRNKDAEVIDLKAGSRLALTLVTKPTFSVAPDAYRVSVVLARK